jgi:lipopolysaccharide export LptBFGC system permease protein LptF
MSWASVYRLALRLLPPRLRRKHGIAMEALFARELGRARARGRLHGTLTGAAGVWDVIRRGAYEHLHTSQDFAEDHRGLMPQPTTRQLLRRHASSFATAVVALTALLLAVFATKQLPALITPGTPSGVIATALVLAIPFVAALTIPMAVLVAVLWEFTRLGADGTLATARRERAGIRRLVAPVLGAAACVAALSFVVTAEIVPRANERLVALLAGHAAPTSDRAMTIGELREAARTVRPRTDALALAQTARYEIEIQKKLALPVACVVLALTAVAIALSVPRGGAVLVIGASLTVFGAYYVLMITGESLANQLVVSPFVAMWGANALLLAAALLSVWRQRARLA